MVLVEYIINERRDLLKDLAMKEKLEEELYKMCDNSHASCSHLCLIYKDDNSHLEVEKRPISIKIFIKNTLLYNKSLDDSINSFVNVRVENDKEKVKREIKIIFDNLIKKYPQLSTKLDGKTINDIIDLEKNKFIINIKVKDCLCFRNGRKMLEKLIERNKNENI